MNLLLLLSSLLFGGSVRDLGSVDFATRDAAYKRLQRYSPLSVVELKRFVDHPLSASPTTSCTAFTFSGDSPRYSDVERRHRIEILLNRIPRFDDWLFVSLATRIDFTKPVTDEEKLLTHALIVPLCEWIDREQLWVNGSLNSLEWVRKRPYLKGSEAGDLLHVLQQVQQKLKPESTPRSEECRE